MRGVGINKSVSSLSCDPIAQRTESWDVMFYCVPTQPKKISAVLRKRERRQLFWIFESEHSKNEDSNNIMVFFISLKLYIQY